jgi:hypothetical protein
MTRCNGPIHRGGKMKPRPGHASRNGNLAWPALLRKLVRVDPSYRN